MRDQQNVNSGNSSPNTKLLQDESTKGAIMPDFCAPGNSAQESLRGMLTLLEGVEAGLSVDQADVTLEALIKLQHAVQAAGCLPHPLITDPIPLSKWMPAGVSTVSGGHDDVGSTIGYLINLFSIDRFWIVKMVGPTHIERLRDVFTDFLKVQ